jgi:nicotinate-nucleotide adenylyltransferase
MCSDDWKAGRSVQTRKGTAKVCSTEGVNTKIVLFGGTFDPPHIGHLTMAQLAYEQTGAKEVWFMPAPTPPHKLNENIHSLLHRTQMVESLVASYAHLKVMPLENQLPVPSYTVDTIRACKRWFPQLQFRMLIGGDSLCHLPTWHAAEELVQMVEFLVAARTGYPYEETLNRISGVLPGIKANRIEMPVLDVSSTWIRERLNQGLPVCGLLPEQVQQVWMNAVAADRK